LLHGIRLLWKNKTMKRIMKILLFEAMLLTIAANACCGAADVSTNTVNEKPVVMNGVILDSANAKKELTPEEQAARFKSGWDGMISEGTRAIELTPENYLAYSRRAHPELSKGDYEGAIADYTKAIELTTNVLRVAGWFYDRGLAKQAKGDFDGAIADFTKAVELNPNNYAKGCLYYSYSARGYVKLSKGDFDGAIVDFNKAEEIQPDNAGSLSSYNKRGSAKRFKGDLDGAIADYTKIIEIKDAADKKTDAPATSARYRMFYYTAAYYNRGLAKGAKGDLDGEKADLTDALKLNPSFSEAQMRLDELHQK
jgi:tetratricopeptide (TPR) repeat protein